MSSCWACDLANGLPGQHKTAWHTLSLGGACVTDLHSREYDLRLLYVPTRHVACGDEPQHMRYVAKHVLEMCASSIFPEYDLAEIEMDDHSYKEHWHAQAGLVEEEK